MKKKGFLKVFLLIVILIPLVAIAATGILFRDEISIICSIQKNGGEHPFYTMEYKNGYHLDEMLEKDIGSDREMGKYLVEYISHGFYTPPETPDSHHIGCSTLVCKNKEGRLLWGRNFDWDYSTPIIVKATPENGYASISTCEFTNITGKEGTLPEGLYNSFLAIAAYYVPMDGINEKGLCVAELEVNEGGQKIVETGKKKITTTIATRLLLDKAATVDEAIALLNKYDICPSGNISAHLSISDRSGKAVVVEFMDGKIEVVPTNVVTNFNIKNGNPDAGGESAKNRFMILSDTYKDAAGSMSASELTAAMEKA